jgi:hypothetical protein
MSISGEVYEPKVIYNILKGLLTSESEKKPFAKWNENVYTRKSIHLPLSSFFTRSRSQSVFKAGKSTGKPSQEGKRS